MKNLHLIPNGEIARSYIGFVNKNFNVHDHVFFLIGNSLNPEIVLENNVTIISKKNWTSIFLLIKEFYICRKIFLHGLFASQIVFLFFVQPWLLKKSYWIIWGGDLYWHKVREDCFKDNLLELMRCFVIKHMKELITYIKGDYDLTKLWYGAQGTYRYCFMYPSNLYKSYDVSKIKKDNTKTYIQIGNSANPSNNHMEVFQKLVRYKNDPIKIICPLSYGSIEYRERVIKEGKRIFGDKFQPLIDFIPFEEYLECLAQIDIAIFNHDRQQAMGNIITLLGLGKKVYIRDDITTWDFCTRHGLIVYSTNQTIEECFNVMPETTRIRNIFNVKKCFSKKKLRKDWGKIFSG